MSAEWKQNLCNCAGDCEICKGWLQNTTLKWNIPYVLVFYLWSLRSFCKIIFEFVKLIYGLQGCCVSFCSLCQNYRTAENLGKLTTALEHFNWIRFETFAIILIDILGKSGLVYTLLFCLFPCIPILLLRQEARERYNIEVMTNDRCQMIMLTLMFPGKYSWWCHYLLLLHFLCHVSNCCWNQE